MIGINFKTMETNKTLIALSLILLIFSGCKKLVEVDGPVTSISSKNVFDNDETAAGAINYLYANLSRSSTAGPGELVSLSCNAGLSSDELSYYKLAGNNIFSVYFENALTNLNAGAPGDYWGVNYVNIYAVNSAIEGLAASTRLSQLVKQQLLGEAKFMRAFYYFYLVNLYGDLPLVLTTDYTINATIPKSSKTEVYRQIITDLKDAQGLLSEKYLKGDATTAYPTGAEERIRPTKSVATALLSRTYLYVEDWPNAELQASVLLANTSQYNLESIDRVFQKNNKEAIWQLQPVSFGDNTGDATLFILTDEGPSPAKPLYLSEGLIKSYKQEDQRRNNWIGSVTVNGTTYYYPYKYKIIHSTDPNAPVTEYNTVMRLAEQYLIRAEARAEEGKLNEAIADLDMVRNRAGLSLIKNLSPGINRTGLLDLILEERRRELFTEWGHRWLDLKRTSKINEVMIIETPKKANGAPWKNFQQYYPISSTELQANPSLKQVNGY